MNLEKELTELKAKVTPINTAKFIVGTVISCGAMAAVVAALGGNIKSAKGLTKIMMKLGVFTLGCKAGRIAEEFFDEEVDSVIDRYKEAKEEVEHESAANKQ